MEKKALLHFQIQREERSYEFIAPLGAPFGETHDVLYEMIKEILVMAKERSETLKNNKEEESEAEKPKNNKN